MSEKTIQLEIDSISALFAYFQLTFLPWHLTTTFTEGYFISEQRATGVYSSGWVQRALLDGVPMS
jgi:hypothetical protein